jgi:hypothetical protein
MGAPSTHAHGLWKSCINLLTRGSFRSENCKIAEQTLALYKPYDQTPFELTPLSDRSEVSVFKGTDAHHADQSFILKVIKMDEALNDYMALKILKKAQLEISDKIDIVDSVILTQKTKKRSLTEKAVIKSPFIQGRPLVEILADPKEPTLRKSALYKKFSTWVGEMNEALELEGFKTTFITPDYPYFIHHKKLAYETQDFLKSQPKILKATRAWQALFEGMFYDHSLFRNLDRLSQGEIQTLMVTHSDLQIILKSDNILVDDHDHLTLIDPF